MTHLASLCNSFIIFSSWWTSTISKDYWSDQELDGMNPTMSDRYCFLLALAFLIISSWWANTVSEDCRSGQQVDWKERTGKESMERIDEEDLLHVTYLWTLPWLTDLDSYWNGCIIIYSWWAYTVWEDYRSDPQVDGKERKKEIIDEDYQQMTDVWTLPWLTDHACLEMAFFSVPHEKFTGLTNRLTCKGKDREQKDGNFQIRIDEAEEEEVKDLQQDDIAGCIALHQSPVAHTRVRPSHPGWNF